MAKPKHIEIALKSMVYIDNLSPQWVDSVGSRGFFWKILLPFSKLKKADRDLLLSSYWSYLNHAFVLENRILACLKHQIDEYLYDKKKCFCLKISIIFNQSGRHFFSRYNKSLMSLRRDGQHFPNSNLNLIRSHGSRLPHLKYDAMNPSVSADREDTSKSCGILRSQVKSCSRRMCIMIKWISHNYKIQAWHNPVWFQV